MNVRFVRTLALAASVCVASAAPAAHPTSSADKAAEANRLAAQAAELANRAAALAAESQASSAPKAIHILPAAHSAWEVNSGADVTISDADSQPIVSDAVPSIGWRSPRTASESSIRFSSSLSPATTTTATSAPAMPSAASELKLSAAFQTALTNTAPTAERPTLANSAASKQSDAEKVEQKIDEPSTKLASTAKPAAPLTAKPATEKVAAEKVAAEAPAAKKPTETKIAPSEQDSQQELAATLFKDSLVRPAADADDDAEQMPAPMAPYDDKRLAGSEPCECVDGCEADVCCHQPRPLFWSSGIEATFLRPDLNEGSAAFAVEEYAYDRADTFSTFTDDVDDFYMAPRLWFGVQGCLWGANVRYWHLRASEGSYDPTLGSNGEWDGPNCGATNFGYNSCNDLEAYTIDFEVTRRFCLHDCWMQFSLGARHAEIEHNASLFASALADDAVAFGFAGAHRQTRGTGIVLGWYGRKPIFPCSCVHWFYNFHWSALWGPTETAAETGVMLNSISQDPDAVAAAGSVNGASTAYDDNLFIGEIQLGLEWDYALQCLPANAFCRLAFEYQRWTGGVGYSAANSFAGVEIDDDPTFLADALAIADAPELDLIGLAVSTGLTW